MKTTLLVVAVWMGLTSCASVPVEEASAGHLIVASARQIGSPSYAGEWRPEESQVAMLEKKLGRLFARPDERMQGLLSRDGSPPRTAPFPLSDYFIRYCGVIRDGKKIIIGQARHRKEGGAASLVVPSDDRVELIVFGGGSYYYTVSYDSQTEEILTLVYNAPL